MDAAVPVKGLAPAEAMRAAPISAIEAVWVGALLPRNMSTILRATAFPIIADGMPVRGGAGEIIRPSELVRNWEIGCRRSKRDAGREQIRISRVLVITRRVCRPPLRMRLFGVVRIHFHEAAGSKDELVTSSPLRLNAFTPTPANGGSSIAISNGNATRSPDKVSTCADSARPRGHRPLVID